MVLFINFLFGDKLSNYPSSPERIVSSIRSSYRILLHRWLAVTCSHLTWNLFSAVCACLSSTSTIADPCVCVKLMLVWIVGNIWWKPVPILMPSVSSWRCWLRWIRRILKAYRIIVLYYYISWVIFLTSCNLHYSFHCSFLTFPSTVFTT